MNENIVEDNVKKRKEIHFVLWNWSRSLPFAL